MKQYEQVIRAMENNYGYSTLGYLYQSIDVKDWSTKTPFASIRRIVQDDRFFFKIKPGLWALKDYREKVLKKFNLTTNEKKQENLFNHTYYQGLIVEIGNIKNYKTYVPNQDKNRLFLDRPLKELTDLQEIHEFTYPAVVKRAKTVDVIWFNSRKFPYAFFEVEHSTDFQNSLGKYADLRDFNSKFFLVSTTKKKRKFEDIINRNLYKEIKNRVKFVDYDLISNLHAKTFEIAELHKRIKL